MSTKSILVDWHGPADYERAFPEILASDRAALDFYFYYDRRTGKTRRQGKNTCRADCDMCFLKIPGAEEESVPLDQAIEIAGDLHAEGYTGVGLVPSDNFSEELLASKGAGGSSYRIPGVGQMAWTSGVALALDGWEEMLEQGWQAGYRSLVMNGHDSAGTEVPFAGVTRAGTLLRALNNLKAWNAKNPDRQIDWGMTFTLRAQTCTYEVMAETVRWAVANGMRVLRFNNFANYLKKPEHEQYVPSREQIVEMYRSLARLHIEYLDDAIQLSVSEDFGEAGIEAIEPYIAPEYRSQRVGICRAGWRLFAITPINGVLTVVGCVDRIAPYLGRVVRRDGNGPWTIAWELDRVEALRQARLEGSLYGCFGGVGRDRPEGSGFNTPAANAMLAENTTWAGR